MTDDILETATRFLPLLVTATVVMLVLVVTDRSLKRRWKDRPDAQFRFQLIMLALTFAGILAVIVAMPVTDALRAQLLSLIGILLSAAIALSSTTFIGNIMAGIMLKAMRNVRPGDFITVAELTGRITEMGLLHTEIQTEFRDLVTVPNLYMVTQPVKVVRASGTIITAEVSLGYDVAHRRVVEVLRGATGEAGLGEGFVQVRALGDFSVVYRVAGLLEDGKSLISARSRLHEAMLDALHEAGIEIVSPNFMNTRALSPDRPIIPERPAPGPAAETPAPTAEDIAFDKAEDAASIETIRKAIEKLDAELEGLAEAKEADAGQRRPLLERRRELLVERLRLAEETLKASEQED